MQGLSEEIQQALTSLGYAELTEVQQAVIPAVLAKQDLIVSAPTGSGKTAAYAIPICEKIVLNLRRPQALVLVPTRELTQQVKQTFSQIGRFKKIRCAAILGKQSMALQRNELRQRVHVVAGTPGRTLEHLSSGTLDHSQIRWLILDEADKMLDFGFLEQIQAIIALLPPERLTLLFSATIPEPVEQLCRQYLRSPQRISIEAEKPLQEKIRQYVCSVSEQDKPRLILHLLKELPPVRCILFCNSRDRVDALTQAIQRQSVNNYLCYGLHGGMEQNLRLQIMKDFKRGAFALLVATDVAARGIDVDGISLVVNVDMPPDMETYLHRIGRTGRLNNEGAAISFVTESDQPLLAEWEALLQYSLPRRDFSALVNDTDLLPETIPPALQGVTAELRLNRDICTIRINAGRKAKLRPGDILGAITAVPGITAADTGIIDIQDSCSYVELFHGKGPLVLEAMATTKIKGKLRSVRLVGLRES